MDDYNPALPGSPVRATETNRPVIMAQAVVGADIRAGLLICYEPGGDSYYNPAGDDEAASEALVPQNLPVTFRIRRHYGSTSAIFGRNRIVIFAAWRQREVAVKPRRRARSARARGFTLIEVMVALGVMTVGVFGLIALQLYTIRSNSHARQLGIATQIAQQWIERIKQDAHTGTPRARPWRRCRTR